MGNEKLNPHEFSKEWYREEDIYRSINNRRVDIPSDIYSREFAEWLTNQYRLAMMKGMQIAKEDRERN